MIFVADANYWHSVGARMAASAKGKEIAKQNRILARGWAAVEATDLAVNVKVLAAKEIKRALSGMSPNVRPPIALDLVLVVGGNGKNSLYDAAIAVAVSTELSSRSDAGYSAVVPAAGSDYRKAAFLGLAQAAKE